MSSRVGLSPDALFRTSWLTNGFVRRAVKFLHLQLGCPSLGKTENDCEGFSTDHHAGLSLLLSPETQDPGCYRPRIGVRIQVSFRRNHVARPFRSG
jgi:hypothetical protein